MDEWVAGEITECPSKWFNEYALVFETHSYLDRGVLPHSGGWADQPAKLMMLAGFVASEVVRRDKRRAEANGSK